MCLAIPAKIIELRDNQKALADIGGVQREISLALLQDIHADDFVIVHVGFALSKLDEEEAKKTLALFSEMLEEETA